MLVMVSLTLLPRKLALVMETGKADREGEGLGRLHSLHSFFSRSRSDALARGLGRGHWKALRRSDWDTYF